jgi:trans-aconitate methyltransferase
MTIESTTSQAFFEEKYKRSGDPWAFATSVYEQQRYAAILSAIGHRRYRHAFEPGCSIGVLTERLASFCGRVDATDISPTAIAVAMQRTRHLANVQTTCGALPGFIPDGNFDLIVFSEIGYYFTEDALFSLARELVDRNCKSGVFLAAHWLGESPDHLLSGDRVHEVLAQVPNLFLQHAERHPGFRLDVWTRT